VGGLSPGHCRRGDTRPVSYYALFQGWLLLSQPPGCLGIPTSFDTEPPLRDLTCGSGLFPFRRCSLSRIVSLGAGARRFGVWLGLVSGLPPSPVSALPAVYLLHPLHLNAFRGEPAISAFVGHVTSTHSSSNRFATRDSAGLHAPLRALHPGHG